LEENYELFKRKIGSGKGRQAQNKHCFWRNCGKNEGLFAEGLFRERRLS
jgi:hypothetical protein